MSSILAKAGMTALITLGVLSAILPAASASARDFAVGVHEVRYEPHRRTCSPILAVQKARAHGLRAARITDITPRRVVVEGRDRRGRDRVVFANVAGCPLIRR